MEPDVALWNGHQAACSIPTSSGGGVRSDPRLPLALAGQSGVLLLLLTPSN